MKRCLIDTGSAILVFRAGLFEILCQTVRTMAAEAVAKEMCCPGYPGYDCFISQIDNNKLTILPAPDKDDISRFSNLGAGEAQTLGCFVDKSQSHADFIIVDDKQAASQCYKLDIPFINALLVPKLLKYAHAIDNQKACDAKKMILTLGRYSNQVIQKADRMGKDQMADFL